MVDSFAQAYHWDLDKIVKLKMPQLIMLSHAAHINSKRMDERLDSKRKNRKETLDFDYSEAPDIEVTKDKNFDPVVDGGVKLSELKKEDNMEKLAKYFTTFPKGF